MRPEAIEIPEHQFTNRTDRLFRASGHGFDSHSAAGATFIELYDEIGPGGITAKEFRSKLAAATGDVTLRINSPGGGVFDGLTIFNDLLAHKGKIRVEIAGLAASIASIVAMAGDEIAIASNAFLMIHNSWVIAGGDRNDFDEISARLKQIDASMAKTYATRCGMAASKIAAMMDEETWLKGTEAKDAGFATEILEPVELKARFDLSVFAKAPSDLQNEIRPLKPADITNVRDFERYLRDAGFSRSRAKALSAEGYKASQAQRDAETQYSKLAAYIAAKSNFLSETI